MILKLVSEHPLLFDIVISAEEIALKCHLTGEVLLWNYDYEFLSSNLYKNSFEALTSQVQEDVVIQHIDPEQQSDFAIAVSLCSSGFTADWGIGLSFFEFHEDVVGFERQNAHSERLVSTSINKGPFVRFAWGITFEPRLNLHCDPPDGILAEDWRDATFDPNSPRVFVRVERQVIFGFPDVNAFMFSMRPYHYDVVDMTSNQRETLISALRNLKSESKIVLRHRPPVISYLEHLNRITSD